ncbi:unnamed protein product, partial [Mesorhabditis belari]|uniref:Uncharacterized protein n=1 Tax=Mesorhabditis belari TaxID=2138241 RepID=A0AAF3F7Y4_9BILA
MEDWTWRLESPFSLYRKIFESIIETCSERRNVLQNLIGFISEDKEQCGTEKIPLTLIVAKKMIYRNCPQHREHYQRICFIHDLCYGAVLKKTHTKEQCDQSRTTISPMVIHKSATQPYPARPPKEILIFK